MLLPVGVSDFRKLIEYRNPLNQEEAYLFVDKTLLIKEILSDGSEVIVITRPRRFGKTINLSMMHYFFASSVMGQSTANLFEGLAISKQADCMAHQGRHPVISISLKDIKYNNYQDCMQAINVLMSETYQAFSEQLLSDKFSQPQKEYIDLIISGKADIVNLANSLKKLLGFVHTYYGVKPILLIDEYDTPIIQSYIQGFYAELIPFFRGFLASALKDSLSLGRGILTGILRIAKESLFSDLNNVKVYSMLNKKYGEYFGFTENEVDVLFEKQGLKSDKQSIRAWYNGYSIGDHSMYNPWSIISCLSEEGDLKPYWINTSGNDLIRKMIIQSDSDTQEKISLLLKGEVIKEAIDENIVFRELEKNRAAIWGLFLMAGYLNVVSVESSIDGDVCELALPNLEIESLYRRISREWLSFC